MPLPSVKVMAIIHENKLVIKKITDQGRRDSESTKKSILICFSGRTAHHTKGQGLVFYNDVNTKTP